MKELRNYWALFRVLTILKGFLARMQPGRKKLTIYKVSAGTLLPPPVLIQVRMPRAPFWARLRSRLAQAVSPEERSRPLSLEALLARSQAQETLTAETLPLKSRTAQPREAFRFQKA